MLVAIEISSDTARQLRDACGVALAGVLESDRKLLTLNYRDRIIELWQDADGPTYFALIRSAKTGNGTVHISNVNHGDLQAIYDAVCESIDRRITKAEARKARKDKH